MKRVLAVAAVFMVAAGFTFGGWAVTTVEDVPEFAVAGRPFDVTYTVRQHGFTLLTRLTGSVTVSADNQQRTFPAVDLGEGMYKSRVTLPSTGTWTVRIHAGFGDKAGSTFTVRTIDASTAAPPAIPAFDRGHQLFIAKGCATCHSHQLTRQFYGLQAGPDLSEPKFAPAYLERFLANPSVKTDWRGDARMPNLGLKPAEIGALVAFLNQDRRR